MSEKQEMIADIVVELRRGGTDREFAWVLADRIEVAHSRELATTEKVSVVGNAAMLREALAAIISGYEKADLCDKHYGEWCHDPAIACANAPLCKAIHAARAALAEPPRECDRFADDLQADGLHEAFVKHCNDCDCPICIHRMEMKGLLDVRCASILTCFASFALSEADTEKEGAK